MGRGPGNSIPKLVNEAFLSAPVETEQRRLERTCVWRTSLKFWMHLPLFLRKEGGDWGSWERTLWVQAAGRGRVHCGKGEAVMELRFAVTLWAVGMDISCRGSGWR